MTYALLESAAATSLCAGSLVSKLGLVIDKTHAEIQTATANCDPCHQKSECVNVQGVNKTKSFVSPESYVVKQLADVSSHIPRQEVANSYPHLQNLTIPQLPVENTELLIGCDAHETFKVIEQKCGAFGEPIGVRTRLGWCIFGADYKACTGPENVCGVSIRLEPALSEDFGERVLRVLEQDFADINVPQVAAPSRNDQKALHKMESTCEKVGEHYQMALPWKNEETKLPDNRAMAQRRLNTLKKKLEADSV